MKELQAEETTEETADLVRLEGNQSGTGILQHPALIPTQIFTPGSDANTVSVHPSWSKENEHKQEGLRSEVSFPAVAPETYRWRFRFCSLVRSDWLILILGA